MQRSSDSIGALAAALAKAQSEIANPEKSLTATIISPFPREGTRAPLSSGLDLIRKCLGQHAISHGLTAETVIDALEDAEDYAAFQMAVTADYDAQSAVERELVLRLASLLWRLRRATAIETGLFKLQARYLPRHKKKPQTRRERPQTEGRTCGDVVRLEERGVQQYGYQPASAPNARSLSAAASGNPSDDLTRSFVRLNNLGTCPLDRLSRYKAMLWRQACQLLFTL